MNASPMLNRRHLIGLLAAAPVLTTLPVQAADRG